MALVLLKDGSFFARMSDDRYIDSLIVLIILI